MSDKKNIESFFQEKFSNFEVTPPKNAWKNIELKLENKKVAPILLPIWSKIAGVAAVFIVGFFVLNNNQNNNKIIKSDIKVTSENSELLKTEANKNNATIANSNNLEVKNDNSVAENNAENVAKNTNSLNEKIKTENKIKTNSVAENNVENIANNTKSLNEKINTENKIKTNSVAENNVKNIAKNTNNLNKKIKTENKTNNKISVAENNAENIANSTNSLNEKIKTENKIKTNSVAENNVENSNSKLVTIINLESKNIKFFDLLTSLPNSNWLNKLMPAEELPKIVAENKIKKEVILRPNASPVFMNANSGSPIDTRFADNSKTYNNTMSYGIGVDVSLSKKWAFRTGINKINLSYNTNNVSFYNNLSVPGQSPNNPTRTGTSNINLSQTASLLTISDTNAIDPEVGQNQRIGSLNQYMSYLEFPLELSYKIVNKKIGVHIISGISTLILNDNNLMLQTNEGINMQVGEANNLNPIHFSTNVGLGVKYKFWKNFEANFEPTLKYQFFTFNKNAGGFKPYFVGIYTGLNYKF